MNFTTMTTYQGNWTCSTCSGAITELPFQPRSNTGLTCRTCYAKAKGGPRASTVPASFNSAADQTDVPDFDESSIASEPMQGDPFAGMDVVNEKPKFSGDWACALCGAAIATLPFEPRNTDNLKCIDCFKASKN